MAQKDFTHGTGWVGHPSTLAMNRRRMVLVLMGIALVMALVVAILRPTANRVSSASTARVVPYGNALEMQYARPWLNAQKYEATPIPYSNALEMQYAWPWLEVQENETATPTRYNEALSWFYARPWLTPQTSLNCHSRLDILYACQYGYWQP